MSVSPTQKRKTELTHRGMTHDQLVRKYFDSRKMIDEEWVLDDAEWLEDVAFSCGEHLEARNFLFMGGEAIVIQCYDWYLDRLCVVKIPRPDLPEVARKRFVRSARTMASLKNGYFQKVYFLSVKPFFVCLSWVVGATLRDWANSQYYDRDAAIMHFRGVLEGVCLLHADGVIHRDIRPDNIIITKEGTIKIIDFGMAKSNESKRLTTVNALGSWAYSPPEQLTHAGDITQPSADVYSLGLTFLWCVARLEKRSKEEAIDPRIMLEYGLPTATCGWFGRSQALDPAARQQSAMEMLEEYNRIFPPPLPSGGVAQADDLYSLIETLLVLLEGDIFHAELLLLNLLTPKQLRRLIVAAAERRAGQCLCL